MSLTGRIETGRRKQVLSMLRQIFVSTRADRPFPVDGLALLKQDTDDAAFRVVCRVALHAAK